MDYPKHTIVNFAVVLLFLIGVLLLFRSSSLSSPLFLPQKLRSNSTNTVEERLDSALAKASTENKIVIVAVINKAYAEQDVNGHTTMFDLFLSSFWLGEGTRSLVNHLLVVAVDQTAYDRCLFLRLNCFKLETDGVDFAGEKYFMSDDFIKMMWRRTLFLLEVLKRGYSIIFTDTDVMWLRNPFTRLSNDANEDLQISTDYYLGNPRSKNHNINTGFYFVRSNNKTISLFETWYGKKNSSNGQKEQDVLDGLIRHGIIRQLGLRVRFMDTLYFSGFCRDSRDFRAVTTVHANCCRTITEKIADLEAVLQDWKRFKMLESSKSNLTSTVKWSHHRACHSQSYGTNPPPLTGTGLPLLTGTIPTAAEFHWDRLDARIGGIDRHLGVENERLSQLIWNSTSTSAAIFNDIAPGHNVSVPLEPVSSSYDRNQIALADFLISTLTDVSKAIEASSASPTHAVHSPNVKDSVIHYIALNHLLEFFFEASEPFARVIHEPLFHALSCSVSTFSFSPSSCSVRCLSSRYISYLFPKAR
ncbi:uncharacterized protein At1g28695-like [Prosopis cineraria]|uniref:uncharacterized protein At1g28695-like n=1 Tax=Prosopis cineraria TaxID=364024 RepID=UPI00240FB2D9|nr:uncharacterized protein At1g28695-like [Prosopis cineraria]